MSSAPFVVAFEPARLGPNCGCLSAAITIPGSSETTSVVCCLPEGHTDGDLSRPCCGVSRLGHTVLFDATTGHGAVVRLAEKT